jgi:hypothetical protein
MQIALVAVVLLAGMWFTVLKPKPNDGSGSFQPAATPAASSDPVAPGVKGLATAVDKAKGAAATSDAANAKLQSATAGGAAAAKLTPTPAAAAKVSATPKAKAKHAAATKKPAKPAAATKPGTKAAAAPATTKAAAAPAADVDPSDRLLAVLGKGKVLVILFEGKGATDKVARKAVHLTAKHDPKHVVSAYVPITDVGKYEAITSDVQILTSPTVLVIGADHKATVLPGYVDATVIGQAVGDARRAASAAAAAKKK